MPALLFRVKFSSLSQAHGGLTSSFNAPPPSSSSSESSGHLLCPLTPDNQAVSPSFLCQSPRAHSHAHMCSNTSKAVCTHTCLHMYVCTHRSVYPHVHTHTTLQRVCLAPAPGERVPDGQMCTVLERSGLSHMLWKAEQVNTRPDGATSSQVPSILSDGGPQRAEGTLGKGAEAYPPRKHREPF